MVFRGNTEVNRSGETARARSGLTWFQTWEGHLHSVESVYGRFRHIQSVEVREACAYRSFGEIIVIVVRHNQRRG